MKNVLQMVGAALVASALWFGGVPALAQTVVPLPVFVDNNQGAVKDLGNGPTEIKMLQGSAQLFTMNGSGVGSTSGSSTSLTLTAVPTTAPCVGCIISGTGITSGTTVSAYNGVTSITLSAAMTVAASTAVAWGAACPTTFTPPITGVILVQAGVGADLPLYTQARVCAAGQFAAGATLLQFPIGAH